MPEAVIVATARSPIGRAFKGSLVDTRADDLLAEVTQAALARIPELDPTTIDEFLIGTALPGGELGFNLGRVIPVLLGLDGVPGATVNRFCASSVQTTRMAVQAIRSGDGHVYVSGGADSASRAELGNPNPPEARNVRASGTGETTTPWSDPRERGETPNVYIDMGDTAENVASLHGISRWAMDEYALRSQTLYEQRRLDGFWASDITPVHRADGTVLDADEGPRAGTTLEKLSELAPVFREDGLITAGNACGLNDGAAAVVVMSDVRARELGITPLARVVSTAVSALSPEIMGMGPVEASQRALAAAGMTIADIDQVEINEAFAAQVIPSYEQLGAPIDKVNINGGAIALGHPFGMTGARITSTLINSLRWHDQQFGLETMCIAGGMGMAMVIERLS